MIDAHQEYDQQLSNSRQLSGVGFLDPGVPVCGLSNPPARHQAKFKAGTERELVDSFTDDFGET